MSRHDGRAADALRPVTFAPHYTRYAEGSVLVGFGETRVLCNASVDTSLPPWLARQAEPQGWITATYNMLPRSTHTRTDRETRGLGGRTQEIQRLIGRSLRAAVDLKQLQGVQITIDCDVLQADGGTRTAAISGGYVALALALPGLLAQGLALPGTVLTPVAAVSVGVVDGEAVLDLPYDEDSRATVDFNVVKNAEGDYIEVQGSAEQGGSFNRAQLDRLLALADGGLEVLFAAQQQALTAAFAAGS